MPVWVQFAAAFIAMVTAGIMGKALIPFLQKYRCFEPEKNKKDFPPNPDETTESDEKPPSLPDEDTQIRERLKPTMCGILLFLGCTVGMVFTFTLCDGNHVFDRTDKTLAEQRIFAQIIYFDAVALAIWGFLVDMMSIKKDAHSQIPFGQQFGSVIAISYVVLQYLLNQSIWYHLLTAIAMAVCWAIMQGLDKETDGITVTTGSIQLLILTILFLKHSQYYFAILSLCGAGAGMGCMIWNLYPAKCRLGSVGSGWEAGIVTGLCMIYGDWKIWLLLMAVYLVNVLPLLNRKNQTLLSMMEHGEMKPWQRIALFSGFTAFCGVIAVL